MELRRSVKNVQFRVMEHSGLAIGASSEQLAVIITDKPQLHVRLPTPCIGRPPPSTLYPVEHVASGSRNFIALLRV